MGLVDGQFPHSANRTTMQAQPTQICQSATSPAVPAQQPLAPPSVSQLLTDANVHPLRLVIILSDPNWVELAWEDWDPVSGVPVMARARRFPFLVMAVDESLRVCVNGHQSTADYYDLPSTCSMVILTPRNVSYYQFQSAAQRDVHIQNLYDIAERGQTNVPIEYWPELSNDVRANYPRYPHQNAFQDRIRYGQDVARLDRQAQLYRDLDDGETE